MIDALLSKLIFFNEVYGLSHFQGIGKLLLYFNFSSTSSHLEFVTKQLKGLTMSYWHAVPKI
jgi:hypothetical protein